MGQKVDPQLVEKSVRWKAEHGNGGTSERSRAGCVCWRGAAVRACVRPPRASPTSELLHVPFNDP